MKILSVRFKNLNSLTGEWFIDFTTPDYDGLFAITGPTGAGKSTILDAICLGLYGSTPRLNKVTGGANDIMSRLTGECFSRQKKADIAADGSSIALAINPMGLYSLPSTKFAWMIPMRFFKRRVKAF